MSGWDSIAAGGGAIGFESGVNNNYGIEQQEVRLILLQSLLFNLLITTNF